MNLIKLEEIIVDTDRQRQSFKQETIEELALSIDTIGLLHPLTLRNDKLTLVAGEYRTKALAYLFNEMGRNHYKHDGQVVKLPYAVYNTLADLNEAETFRAELEENLRRSSLDWREEAKALAKLQDLMSKSLTLRTANYTEVAQEAANLAGVPLKKSDIERTTKAIQITKFLDNPEVAQAQSLKDAETAAKKIILRDFESVLSETGTREVALALLDESTPENNKAHITVKLGDYKENLVEGVDLYLMDPPYFVGAENFGTQSAVRHEYVDTATTYSQVYGFYSDLASNCFNKAAEQCHVYMFFDWSRWDIVKDAFEHAGWDVWRKPMMWVKDVGMYPDPDHGPRYTYECIMMASRGRKPFKGVYNDTFIFPTVRNKVHGAQKPAALIKALAKTSITEGDVVVDYFGGSGAIIEALRDEAIFLHVVELNKDYYNKIMEKLC